MKRHIKVSLTLAALSLTTVALLTGCNSSSDLEAKVDQNQADLQASLRDAIKAAEDNLAAAKTELQTLVASGDEASAEELNKAVTELNAAIEAAKKLVADGDAATKTELLAKIEEAKLYAIDAASTGLDTAKKELEAAIVRGDLSTAEQLSQAVTTLQEAIDAAKTTAANADAALKAELVEAIEAVKKEAADAVSATIESAVADVRAAVEAGDAQGALDLEDAVTELSNAIELAKAFALESDDALKNELLEAVDASKLEATDAIANGIDAATKELEAKIAAGQEESIAAIKVAVDNLQLHIQAAEKLATDSDAVLREELMAAITEAQTSSVAYVDEAIDVIAALLREEIAAGDEVSAEQIEAAVAEVNATIETLKTFATDADATLEGKFEEKIAAVKGELAQSFADEYAKMVADFDEKLANGATTSAKDLADAVETMNATIEAAKTFAADADTALKEELETVIADAKAEAVATMQAALDAAVADLEAKVEAGNVSNAEALKVESDALKVLIEAAKTFATDADAELKAELEANIADVKASVVANMQSVIDAAVADLEAKVEAGNVSGSEALKAEVDALKELVEAAKTFAADADAALKAELETTIADAKTELVSIMRDAIDVAIADLEVKLENTRLESSTILESTVADLMAMIDEAKTIANDADKALADEMNVKFEEVEGRLVAKLEAAISELQKSVEESLASRDATAEALASDVAKLNDAIAAAQELAEKADADVKAELEATISTTKLELMSSVEEKLAALKEEMLEAVKNSKSDVESKLTELSETVDVLNTLYTEADAALKEEVTSMIDEAKNAAIDAAAQALASAKAELEELIAQSDATNASNLASAKVELELKIAEIKELCDGLSETGATTEYVDSAISTLQESLTEAINAVRDAGMKLADWNAATEGIFGVEGGFAKLDELYAVYQEKENTYVNGDFAKVTALYNEYWVRLVRATSVQDITDILAAFDEEAADIRTIPDAIYDAIMEVGESVDDVEYDDDAEGLAAVKVLLEQAAALNNTEVNEAILAYGENMTNLQALYESYVEQYNALLKKSNGQGIKDRMDAVIENPIVWDDGTATDSIKVVLEAIRADYNTWISDTDNALSNVDGFSETYAQFVESETRYAALVAAKAEADGINSKIESLTTSVTDNGATIYNRDELAALNERVANWINTYFSDEYASEVNTSDNYALVNHSELASLNTLFEEKVAAYRAAASKFANAVDAIGDVNLLSWDEINTALKEYGDLVLSRDLNDFNYLFNDTDTPADYYDRLVSLYAEYRTLKTSAANDYATAFGAVDGLSVSLYDGDKVNAILAWYNTYGVNDAEGNITFDNGDVGTGYILSSSVTVDADDYAEILEMKADYDALVAAKVAEKAELEAAIDAIGTVTVGRKEYIDLTQLAYQLYINGANAPEGFTSEQFNIKVAGDSYAIANVDVLKNALEQVDILYKEGLAVQKAVFEVEAKTTFTDFSDATECAEYKAQLETVRKAIEVFIANNNGTDDGMIKAVEYAKLDAAEVAVVKYENVVSLTEVYNEAAAAVSGYSVSDADKDYLAGVVDTIFDDTKDLVDKATTREAVDTAITLAYAKFENVKKSVLTYETYVAALDADAVLTPEEKVDLEFRMSLSFETTLNRVVESDTVEDVELNAKFVESELESLYAIG